MSHMRGNATCLHGVLFSHMQMCMQVAYKLLVPCLLFTKVASVTAQQRSLQLASVPILAAAQVTISQCGVSPPPAPLPLQHVSLGWQMPP